MKFAMFDVISESFLWDENRLAVAHTATHDAAMYFPPYRFRRTPEQPRRFFNGEIMVCHDSPKILFILCAVRGWTPVPRLKIRQTPDGVIFKRRPIWL